MPHILSTYLCYLVVTFTGSGTFTGVPEYTFTGSGTFTGVPDHRSTGAPETWNLQRLWELTIASSKVLQGPPRSSKMLQGPPRPRKPLSYNRPWRTSDDLHMTHNNLGDYLQYICYLVGYLSSISNLATGLLTLRSLLETVTL